MSGFLDSGEISVEGRFVDASNATLLVTIGDSDVAKRAIYKPIAGERPLWDFPEGTLAYRERAAYIIDQALGHNHVPRTILRDGPFGMGMVQEWIQIDEAVELENYFRLDLPELREVALFDAIVNNTDRKIGHLIPSIDGRLYICDHGVTFHEEDKLRTVLWQWAGEELTSQELDRINRLSEMIEVGALDELERLLTEREVSALRERLSRLTFEKTFPHPREDWPHIPWPPF